MKTSRSIGLLLMVVLLGCAKPKPAEVATAKTVPAAEPAPAPEPKEEEATAKPSSNCPDGSTTRTSEVDWTNDAGTAGTATCTYCAALEWTLRDTPAEPPLYPLIFAFVSDGGQATIAGVYSTEQMDVRQTVHGLKSAIAQRGPVPWEDKSDALRTDLRTTPGNDVRAQIIVLQSGQMASSTLSAHTISAGFGNNEAPLDDAALVLSTLRCVHD